MGDLPDWVTFDGHSGELGAVAEAIEPFAELAEQWAGIGKALIGLVAGVPLDSPFKVASYVLAHLDDAAVKAVVPADLRERLAAAVQAWDQSRWSNLVKPLSELAERYDGADGPDSDFDSGSNTGMVPLRLPGLTKKQATAAGGATLSFDLAATGAIEVEGGALWPFPKDGGAAGLVRLGLHGAVKAGAGLAAPFGAALSGKLDGGVSGAADLDLYFAGPGDPIFASALLAAVGALPDPFDLIALGNAAAFHGFDGLTLFIKGSVTAGAEIAFGKDFTLPDVLTGHAGLTASANFSRESQWVLSLRRAVSGRGFDVVLSRKKASEAEWALGAGLKLDVSQALRPVKAMLDDAIDFADSRLATLRPFLNPGTYALDALRKEIDAAAAALVSDAGLAKAIASDAQLVIGGTAPGGLSTAQWMAERLADAISAAAEPLFVDADAAVAAVRQQLAALVPVDLRALARPDEALAPLKNLIDALHADFAAAIGKLPSDAKLTAGLSKALSDIGIKVKGAADDADAALAGVRQLFARYDALAKDAQAAVETVTTKAIAANFSLFGSDEAQTHYEIRGHFSDCNPDTARLWRALATGRLQPLQDLLRQPDLVPGFDLDEAQSSIARFASSTRGTAATLALFDIALSLRSVAVGEATVTASGGRIVVKGKAEATNTVTVGGTSRVATFLSVYDLVTYKQGGADRALSLSVDLIRKDDAFRAKDLESFLTGLEEQRIIAPKRGRTARDDLQAALIAAKAKAVSGDVSFHLDLPPTGIATMLALGRLVRPGGVVERALFTVAVEVLLATGYVDAHSWQNAREKLAKTYGTKDPVGTFYLMKGKIPMAAASPPGKGAAPTVDLLAALRVLQPLCAALPALFGTLAEVYDAIPGAGNSVIWTEQDYKARELKIAQFAGPWIPTKRWGQQNPAMLAFLRLLLQLETLPPFVDESAAADAVPLLGKVPDLALSDRRMALTMRLGTATQPTVY